MKTVKGRVFGVRAARCGVVFTRGFVCIGLAAMFLLGTGHAAGRLSVVSQQKLPEIGTIYDVEGVGGDVMIVSGTGVGRYDVSDPSRVRFVTSFLPGLYGPVLTVIGSRAYVADDALEVFYISNISTPKLKLRALMRGGVKRVRATENDIFVQYGGKIAYTRESEVYAAAPDSEVDIGATTFELSGRVIYAGNESGLVLWDFSNPDAPVQIKSIQMPRITDLHLIDSSLYALGVDSQTNSVLIIFDISEGTAPKLVSEASIAGAASRMTISSTNVFVLTESGRIEGFLVSDERKLSSTHSWKGLEPVTSWASGVRCIGDRVYCWSTEDGLRIFGLDGTAMTNVRQFDPHVTATGIAVRDDQVYLSAYGGGLQVYDGMNLTNGPVGHVGLPGHAMDIVLTGKYADVASDFTGIEIVDVSDPMKPVHVGTYLTDGGSRRVVGKSTNLFLLKENGSVEMLDNSDPKKPQYVSTFASVNTAPISFSQTNITANDYTMRMGDGHLDVIDLWQNQSTSIRNSHANGASFDGRFIYAADSSLGVVKYVFDPGPRMKVVQPAPSTIVRPGDSLRVAWVVENSTNTLWQVWMQSDRYWPFDGVNPVRDGTNWTINVPIPSEASASAGSINITSADFSIRGGIALGVAGLPRLTHTFTRGILFMNWYQPLESYEVWTASDLGSTWKKLELIEGEPWMNSGTAFVQMPTTNVGGFYQLRRPSP